MKLNLKLPPEILITRAVLFLFCGILSFNMLFKGQTIKQFFSYSITQSIASGAINPLSTTVPCGENGESTPWVEEPPLFHFPAAVFESLGLPSNFLPLIIFLLFMGLLWKCIQELPLRGPRLRSKQWFAFTAIACLPVYLRYSAQHLPDPLAATFILAAFYFGLKDRLNWMIAFLTLGVTTKASALFAAVGILYGFRKRFELQLIQMVMIIGLVAIPFGTWLVLISAFDVPSPFFKSEMLPLRHAGGWDQLLEIKHWSRMFTWTITKGIGFPLAIGLGAFFLYKRKERPRSEISSVLTIWGASVLASWIFLRSGNFVHDYYFLPYAFPLAALGLIGLDRVALARTVVATMLLISVIYGIAEPLKLDVVADPSGPRPSFCNQENPGKL